MMLSSTKERTLFRMTLRRATSAILLLSFLILAVAPRVGAAPDWWNDNWQFRRKVSLVRTAQRWKDSPAAWVKFHTGGKIKPDGSDIRVVTRSEIGRASCRERV